ncbi:MAG: phosphotransferase family protein [Caldilineaceae bacterium]|nr:phosphotransferase family protein [Caldilineaceae bacterium]MBP8110363.1 phosphotransferase family protein [Caldilineaceae bacterium]MBP8125325.1 phosphotransferase family protein [Caldilineaceae bacterium]MBP9075131.1 phosphotransferase family protein [Caldilineaceae bacterium]
MSDQFIDHARPVRAGEELDGERLGIYLYEQLGGIHGPLTVEQFPSGFSNLTYLLHLGDRELVLRRPPFGANVRGGHDMGREFRILSHLRPVYAKVPEALLYCEDEGVLGAPFYIMERVSGVILRAQMAPAMRPDAGQMAGIAHSFVQNLADLHGVDVAAAGLTDLGRPDGYVQRQIDGWTARYAKARTDDIPAMDRAVVWLADHLPPTHPTAGGACLIHNDYKYDNLILDPADWTQIRAVLDWEMATVGDALMDLGTSLGYWVEPNDSEILRTFQFSPTTLPGNPSRRELVEAYALASGRNVDHAVFYYVYGLVKLAVIVQQIYRRYKLGHTQDPRFAPLVHVVRACAQTALLAIDRNRIDAF